VLQGEPGHFDADLGGLLRRLGKSIEPRVDAHARPEPFESLNVGGRLGKRDVHLLAERGAEGRRAGEHELARPFAVEPPQQAHGLPAEQHGDGVRVHVHGHRVVPGQPQVREQRPSVAYAAREARDHCVDFL